MTIIETIEQINMIGRGIGIAILICIALFFIVGGVGLLFEKYNHKKEK